MGMDVYGKNPTTKAGKYFRNSVWWWHPLAEYITLIAPAEAAPCKRWQDNSGDGLNTEQSIALADVLQVEIDSGNCLQYSVSRGPGNDGIQDASAKASIDAVLGFAKSISAVIEAEPVGAQPGSSYPFRVDNVQDFVNFLRECGGFEIC